MSTKKLVYLAYQLIFHLLFMQKSEILFVTKFYNFDHSGLLVSIPITKMRRWRQSCWKAQVVPEPQIGQMISIFVQKLCTIFISEVHCIKVKQCFLKRRVCNMAIMTTKLLECTSSGATQSPYWSPLNFWNI